MICVGSDYKQEGENLANFSSKDGTAEKAHGGDRYSLRIPSNEVELIHRICADCENTIVDIVGGSAYVIEEWKDEASAILHSFYSGMEGGNALADMLTGKAVPSGHLPFTIAKDENDYPKFLFPGEKQGLSTTATITAIHCSTRRVKRLRSRLASVFPTPSLNIPIYMPKIKTVA